MWNTLHLRLLDILSEPSQTSTNEERQSAYRNFMEQVETVSQSEISFPEIYRTLNNTRIELVFLQTLYRYGQEKKCPEICLS